MQTATKRSPDEAKIIELLDAYAAAIHDKDARATVACYSRDAIAYEMAPPLRLDGEAVHDPSYIQQWFDTWDGAIGTEGHDQELVIGDSVAYAYGLRHMTGTKTDGTHVDLWFRSTMCLRREGAAWKVAHVHNSVPFAMDGSNRALLDLEP